MRTVVNVVDLNDLQWKHVRNIPVLGRTFPPGVTTACVSFSGGGKVFHVEMDMTELAKTVAHLNAIRDAAEEVSETTAGLDVARNRLADFADALLGETSGGTPDRLPVLPTADQVRNLSAVEAAKLARDMNKA